ncbi:hypothetical protein K450DRAFT_247068 [Umbelopsis ramanniana AG]|uniref:Methyltransferase domain-containing protein n=1 Tax=Umbelopsis ramanniana AG TaxID=1314678 RepID=A0AAD5E7V2_UMBRA|nr:uncharacterized protein K450DRAFT_247068 [Umbelopsis ramanniana AG]KAI8578484.1 hypothetical protein K450DRAFT_247068 [Umbelopsis ramanniana AG]
MLSFFSRLKWVRKSKKTQSSKKKDEISKVSSRTSESTNSSSQPKIQTSSVYTNGRRFQAYKDCNYILPNDDTEIDRLHLEHWLMKNVLGRNFSVPIEPELDRGIKVLDAGCGGGTWVLEMANEYPNSDFTGIDVSVGWPTEIRPRNSDFVVGNIVSELPFEDNTFDFVYMRLVGMGVSNDEYPTVLYHIYRVLKPGGWVELVEVDGAQVYRGRRSSQFWNAVLQYLKMRGFKTGIVKDLYQKVEDAGFVNIDGMRVRIPLGTWGGKLGEVFEEDVLGAYRSLRPVIQPMLNFSDDDFQSLLDNLPAENNEVRQEMNWFSNWAQKPTPEQIRFR